MPVNLVENLIGYVKDRHHNNSPKWSNALWIIGYINYQNSLPSQLTPGEFPRSSQHANEDKEAGESLSESRKRLPKLSWKIFKLPERFL